MNDQPPPDAPDEAAGPAEEKAAAEAEQPAQEPWAARRDLDAHTPPSMVFDGINKGVTAHHVIGDIITGGKTEIHYEFGGFGGFGGGQVSGEIPAGTLERLAESFVSEGTAFGSLLDRLRHEHVLVLTGDPFTGRRTAALMLLHHLGATPVHAMDREVTPSELSRRFVSTGEAHGHVLCDLEPSREQPLREAHLLALRGQLREQNAHLVITTGHSPYIEDTVRLAAWQAPAPETVLSTLLHRHLGSAEAHALLARPAVTKFLSRGHQIREVVGYAAVLLRADETEMEQYSLVTLERQVQEWFEEADNMLHLREKAFLIALAAFDNGPYALTAELSDTLYSALLRTGDDRFQKAIPVFGTHIAKRLQIARARRYTADEQTEWGPVTQLKAAFLDDRVAPILLREVWTGHPAARPALIKWLDGLAADGRPFVRTRAAATVAVLAFTDLPSTMALILERWARAKESRRQLTAVSALALAHRIGAPNIPRIISGWSADGQDPKRCWVAVRALGLIGPERPVETLAALRVQARHQYEKKLAQPRIGLGDQQVTAELPQSVALLLLSPAAGAALAELLPTLDGHPSARTLALDGFLTACERPDPTSTPPLLAGYAGAPAAFGGVARLLSTALNDRSFNERAEAVLRAWVRAADSDAGTAAALATLLPALVAGARDAARLDHLLDTVPGLDGQPGPAVAARLRATLAAPLSAPLAHV
ncbi:hypothetical protein ACGFX2_19100 [Streptomyces goshikiensis]|uniref:hypothetical protein n=1 Tax=Streptomyces goshikiensis TaxID=1942 RepID=UPI003718E63E